MATLRSILDSPPARNEHALRSRAVTLLGALGTIDITAARPTTSEIVAALSAILDSGRADLCWLAMSVMSASLPDTGEVERVCRTIRLGEDPTSVLVRAVERTGGLDTGRLRSVSVTSGRVLIDVDQASRNPLGTGIQRVVREAARRWVEHPEATLLGWTDEFDGLRALSLDEHHRAVGGPHPTESKRTAAALSDTTPPLESPIGGSTSEAIIVPWRSTLIVAELAVEGARPAKLAAIARFARCSTGVIGYDCVPLTMGETAVDGMSTAYLRYLAACAHTTRIAAISDTAAMEFQAWRSTLASRGLQGPDIHPVELALETPTPTPADLAEARSELGADALPVVVVVGSHEPRKNHMAVLHAAELLWRRGERFALAFLGGNSWKSDAFFERLGDLQGKGRMVQAISAAPDRLVWAAYRVATCSVFVSLHEGFGLPIVESLAAGTPVVTSEYGAMADNARYGGCLLVDPRDPTQIAEAIRRILTDSDLADTLRRQALAAPTRSWDHYAEQAWDFLVDAKRPPPSLRRPAPASRAVQPSRR